MTTPSSVWIYSARVDLWFIIGPAFLVTATMLLISLLWPQLTDVSPWIWLCLIVGVDVAHVYSTLFRTYLDKEELAARTPLYVLTPLLTWLIGFWLYSVNDMLFWRVLAYAAMFHFVRQQIGFMMIYARHEPVHYKWLDKLAIYGSTIYPLIYWHCHPRNFYWMSENDIIALNRPLLSDLALGIYLLIMLAYIGKELHLWIQKQTFNMARNLMLAGTAFSWITGIVILNNDLAFSAINVLAHGIPYLALIWIYGRNQCQRGQGHFIHPLVQRCFQLKSLWLFILFLFGLAYLEESLWDGWLWREHDTVLLTQWLTEVTDPQLLAGLVPLLAVPQMTHYVLDAFIWRLHTPHTPWKKILFHNNKI